MSRRDGRTIGILLTCQLVSLVRALGVARGMGDKGWMVSSFTRPNMCCSRLSSQKPLDPSISLPLQEKIPFELRSPSSFLSASLHSAQGSSGMLPPFWHLPFKGSSLPCQLEFGFELVNLPTAASQGRLSLPWHLHIRIRILTDRYGILLIGQISCRV